jgi:peroxiredoxin
LVQKSITMKYCYSCALLLLIACLAFTHPAPGYTITGTADGLEDGTWLYLRLAKPEQNIDSCQVAGGRFRMKGRIPEKATLVCLYTARYTNYTLFWLENTRIGLQVKAGEFKKRTVTGSATEVEARHLETLSQPLDLQIDSLEKVRRAAPDTATRNRLSAQLADCRRSAAQSERDYVRHHPNSLISGYLLSVYAATWGKDTAAVLYEGLYPAVKQSGYGKAVQEFIALNRTIRVGDAYVDFRQPNTQGRPVQLSDIQARYVLIDFWASWCSPCRAENPRLVQTYARFKDKGFAVLGVSLDDNRQRWLQAVKADSLTWENVSDLRGDQNKAALIYGITGIPDNFLLDARGTIVARGLHGQALDKKLEELLP